MAFNLMLPTGNGQFLDLGFGPGGNGRPNFSLGVTQFGGYGNALYGGMGERTLGFSTQGGAYYQGSDTQWTPWSRSNQNFGGNAWGNYANNSYANAFGQYANNSYASNVFGGYSAAHNAGNPWGYSSSATAGNYWTGSQANAASWGNAWGGGGSYANAVPGYFAGPCAGRWFGGCF